MLRLLILDVDGVISETEDLNRRAYNRLFAEMGLRMRWTETDYRRRAHRPGVQKAIDLEAEATIPRGSARGVFERKQEIYLALLRSAAAAGFLRPRPGIWRLLREARRARVPVALASSSPPEALRTVLRGALGSGAPRRFAAILSSTDVGTVKPNPGVYRLACRRLRCRPSQAVAIEDSPQGLRAARRAGVPCVVTPSRYTRGLPFAGAAAVVEDLERGPSGPVTLQDLGRWARRKVSATSRATGPTTTRGRGSPRP